MGQRDARAIADVRQATARLLAGAASLTDAQAREASALPGWTRGHLLTHLARNAEAIGNLLRSARTGTEIPMYPSPQARDAAIEAGSGRGAAELLADVHATAEALEAEAASLPETAWAATVRTHRGEVRARYALLMRLSEVEVHHVDLGLGYEPSDWPETFPGPQLRRIAHAMAQRDDTPACVLQPDGADPLPILPAGRQAGDPVTVSGPSWALLAWLLSRRDGAGLTVHPAGPPPRMPAW